MPDDTDLPLEDAPQATEEPGEPSTVINDDGGASSEALIHLALTDLQSRRDTLQQEIDTLQQRKQQLEQEMTASFAGQSDAIARRVRAAATRACISLRETWAAPKEVGRPLETEIASARGPPSPTLTARHQVH